MVDTEILFRIADAAEDEGELDFARLSFERGAALGSVECLTRLANIYDLGLGVAADKRRAMRSYRTAWCRRRATIAANNIAILHRESGDHRAMFKWFRRAAGQGDGSALVDLGKCHLKGVGTPQDQVAALRCLAAATRSAYITEAEREEAADWRLTRSKRRLAGTPRSARHRRSRAHSAVGVRTTTEPGASPG